jgi:hypothetical protein
MQISMETFVLVVSLIGTPLIGGGMVTDDCIVRYVCKREGRKYSVLWLFSSYWRWRTFKLGWFRDAREAGYFMPLAALYAAWVCVVVGSVLLFAGGFVSPLAR